MAMWDEYRRARSARAFWKENQINDPDEWMQPFRDGDRDRAQEAPEVNRLIRVLMNRRMIPRLKKVRTSLRRNG